jgi:ATP synthase protein I
LNLKKNQKNKDPLPNYAKYSGIAIQMIIIILAGVYGGMKLDEYLSLSAPIFTIIFTILSVALSIYFVIRDLLK